MSYKEKARSEGKEVDKVEHPPLPCRQCNAMTAVVILLEHGGLCHYCYTDYCRHGLPYYRAGMGDTRTVADMKTRMRSSGKLTAPEARI